MHLFGEYLCEDMFRGYPEDATQEEIEEYVENLVRRIGFVSGLKSSVGKSTAINALVQTFGEYEIYERKNPGERDQQHQQQLIFSDRVGWVRHYDSSFIGDFDGLPSSQDIEIWKHSDPSKRRPDLAVGLDIVEHPDHNKEGNKNFDIIVALQKQNTHERTLAFAAKQEYIDDPHFMAFIDSIQPALDAHREVKAEIGHSPLPV